MDVVKTNANWLCKTRFKALNGVEKEMNLDIFGILYAGHTRATRKNNQSHVTNTSVHFLYNMLPEVLSKLSDDFVCLPALIMYSISIRRAY